MKKRNPLRKDEGASQMIFFGVPVCVLTALVLIDSKEHIINEEFWPYILFGIGIIVTVLGMFVYNITPKRLILLLGIIGWLVSASILCWVGWFGPHGAFGHH